MDAQVSFSNHAAQRCAERNISFDEVLYALSHGRRVHNAGSLVFFLGKRDIPHPDRSNQRIAQLEGLTVQTMLTDDGWLVVMTVYRNRERGFKDQRRKRKYGCRRDEWEF
jgi:hypothetical protein